MKSLVLISLCFFLIIGVNAGPRAQSVLDGSTANANQFTDELLKNLRPWMITNKLDPFFVKAINEYFWFEWLYTNHTGEIHLRDGWVQDCSTMTRYGDAYLIYEEKALTVAASVELHDVVGNFDFFASLLGLKPKGDLKATITKQLVFLRFTFDLRTSKMTLTDFLLDNKGTIKIKVHDNGMLGIFDGLVNIVVKALQKTFQEKIMATLGKQLKGLVQEKLNEIPPFWPPPPPAGNSTGRSVDLLNVFQRS